MSAFGSTIFLGAFLLFLVQPLIARFILPWFGGAPAVWTTCMLFFQIMLAAGYLLANFSVRSLRPRQQVALYITLTVIALFFLPIVPSESYQPSIGSPPTYQILLLLLVSLGLPFFVLSAASPLLQAWLNLSKVELSPYRFYSLSNIGSLLALLSYPILIEPNFSRQAQAWGWSGGFALFAVAALLSGWRVWKRADNVKAKGARIILVTRSSSLPLFWILLPGLSCLLLLAVTNKICQEIAVVPFFWVGPLALYLISFVICFGRPKWTQRKFWLPIFALMVTGSFLTILSSNIDSAVAIQLAPIHWLLEQARDLTHLQTILLFLATLFACCVVCHEELYRLRPEPSLLTNYYLMIAVGGAGGGLFASLAAPVWFNRFLEFPVGLYAIAVLTAQLVWRDPNSRFFRGRHRWLWAGFLCAMLLIAGGVARDNLRYKENAIHVSRNFYGVLKIEELAKEDPIHHQYRMWNGSITHGFQFRSEEKRKHPTAYYARSSGVGLTIEHFPRNTGRRVGLIGLGVGTLAAYGKPGDYFRFYEINDEVERLARRHFTFLSDSPAQIDVVLGDARLMLAREEPQQFDILVIDAFSSDAIPVHLLTKEAFDIFIRHLKPDGVIAINITNQHLNLEPILKPLARAYHLRTALLTDQEKTIEKVGIYAYSSDWMLMTKNDPLLDSTAIRSSSRTDEPNGKPLSFWTDDHASLLPILILKEDGWLAWLRDYFVRM